MVINTVTYSKDIWAMALQAHSIEKFVISPIVHYVYVQDDRLPIELWNKILASIYKRHTLVLITDKFKIFDDGSNAQGWNEQQYAKLMLASEMQEEYILSLDSKNIFIKPTDIRETFYGIEGTIGPLVDIRTHDHEWVSYWSEWVSLIENVTKKQSPLQQFPATPFVFKKSSLDKMNQQVNVRQIFQETSINGIKPSEFLLYNFFKNDSSRALTGNPADYIFTIYRRDLDNIPGHKDSTKKLLISMGLEATYVNPAIEHTSQNNR